MLEIDLFLEIDPRNLHRKKMQGMSQQQKRQKYISRWLNRLIFYLLVYILIVHLAFLSEYLDFSSLFGGKMNNGKINRQITPEINNLMSSDGSSKWTSKLGIDA